MPVELNWDGTEIKEVYYDKIISPTESYHEYGIEDARITNIDDKYYMTTCSVSSSRHSTVLYSSDNGIDYKNIGIILDHQNKDMVLFPKKINDFYYAFTRPIGDHYFMMEVNSKTLPGPSIFLSRSPDLLHWKPVENFEIRPLKDSKSNMKVGGGAPPIEFEDYWLVIFHGVEQNSNNNVGVYRSFICLLDKNNPERILRTSLDKYLLESNSALTQKYLKQKYLDNVVFTSGIAEDEDKFIIASGEDDLCCRITHIEKNEMRKF